jgi:hypothetical protein
VQTTDNTIAGLTKQHHGTHVRPDHHSSQARHNYHQVRQRAHLRMTTCQCMNDPMQGMTPMSMNAGRKQSAVGVSKSIDSFEAAWSMAAF